MIQLLLKTRTGLVPKMAIVMREGKPYRTTVYVNPSKRKNGATYEFLVSRVIGPGGHSLADMTDETFTNRLDVLTTNKKAREYLTNRRDQELKRREITIVA